jgi:polar amino acid transport system permease protein
VFWRGWLLTIGISLAALVLSSALGLVLAFARRSTFLPLRSAALVYIELLRGSPLLVQILFFWYVVAVPLGVSDRLLVGVLVLSAFSSAYLAEMIRAGIGSVGASQLESARAIGLTRWQTSRFVVFPQALRHVLPPLAGQFASLIKDSSLLSIIGLEEFTFRAQQVNSATYSTLECFLPLGVGYLLLTLPISAISRALERRFHYEN